MARDRTLISSKVSNRRGFTLVEMIATLVVLVVLASMILPNVVSQKASRDVRGFLDALPRIASQARESAITKGLTTKLTYDDGGKRLTAATERPNESDETITEITVPSGVQIQSFQLKGQQSGSADWILHFYPDGRSDGGALETSDNGRLRTLVVDKYGIAKLHDGPLPDQTEERWPAGDYEHRQ